LILLLTVHILLVHVMFTRFLNINLTSTPVIRTGVYPRMPIAVTGEFVMANDCPLHYRFFTFWLWGLTPGPKFTRRGNNLLPTQIYHLAKFHRPASSRIGDIRYKKSVDKQSYKQ